jgi:hypothetical protein
MSVLADAVSINWQHEGSYDITWAPHHAGSEDIKSNGIMIDELTESLAI